MSQQQKFAVGALVAAIGAGAMLTAPSAHAIRPWSALWAGQYPASQTDNNALEDGCQVCHTDANGPARNPYGADFLDALTCNPSQCTADDLVAALVAIENVNSDLDPTGSTNIDEIDLGTQPGFAEGDEAPGVLGYLDPIADIAVTPLAVDFGAVTIGVPQTRDVNIANLGVVDLEVSDLALSGGSEFSLPDDPSPVFVAPGTSLNVAVQYAPTNEGTDNDTLGIASNSPGEEDVSVALSGTGVPQQADACVASVDPASLDFGTVQVGASSTLTTVVTNSGGADCTVAAAVVDSGAFALVSGSNFTVPADGGAVAVDVSYAPTSAGDDAGALELAVASPAANITVPLSGSGGQSPGLTLDLDIKRFSVTSKVSLTKGKDPVIAIALAVNNAGETVGFADATITGMQGGTMVYSETLRVTDGVGGGSTTFDFPSYTPDAAGVIRWTAVIGDTDPDDDLETASTTVSP